MLAYIVTGFVSQRGNQGSDFVYSFLAPFYNKVTGSNMYMTSDVFRSMYAEPGAYFKFEGSNTLYNLYDAGNFMWGSWASSVGYSRDEAKYGPQLFEFFQDTPADQRAIQNGYLWYINVLKK